MKSDVEKLKKVLTRTFYEHNRMTFILALISTILNSILFFGISLIIREMADTISGVEHSKSLGEIAVFILLFFRISFWFLYYGLCFKTKIYFYSSQEL